MADHAPSIENLFGCEIPFGSRAGLVFPAHRIGAPNPGSYAPAQPAASEVPINDDLASCVAHLIALALDETRPSIDWIALELGYADADHFRRAFMTWTGVTPSHWR